MTNDPIRKPADVPLKDTTRVSVDWLKLDRKNPRLTDIRTTEESVVAQLYRTKNLGELLQSISANGYLDVEPLIVCLAPAEREFTVLHGNRRLAAIRLFREPAMASSIFTKEKLKISVPEIGKAVKASLEKVSVYRVPDRDATRSFIGFKHINGAAKWNSYAKARFAADWCRSGDVSLAEISEKIGDRHDTVRRMVAAIYVLEQAERENVFSLTDRRIPKFSFSHLYTALSRPTYMSHLGLETAWARYGPRPDPVPDPVPTDRLDRLREVLVWIYGSKEEDRLPVVQRQNPDIKNLGEALANAEGLHILRAGGTLAAAHSSTRPADETLSTSLIEARSVLREAANRLRGYDGRDRSLLDIAEDVSETAQTIHERMKKKFRDAMGG